MKNTIVVLAVAGAAAMLVFSAGAETIGWWRFEGEVGHKTIEGETFANSVTGANALPALDARSINGKTFGYDSTYMPRYTNAFCTGYKIYDPVTKTSYANIASLSLRDTLTKSSNNNNGLATMSAAHFPSNGNVTIECFYRAPTLDETGSNVTNRDMIQIIIMPRSGGYDYSALIGLYNKSGAARQYYFYGSTSEGGAFKNGYGGGRGSYEADNKWHHVAEVFDFDKKKVYYYVDYTLIQEEKIAGDGIFVNPEQYFMIGGGNLLTNRKFQGHVDEVRISSAALTRDQFLRMIPESTQTSTLADELAHITFETPSWWGGNGCPFSTISSRFGIPYVDGVNNSSLAPTSVVPVSATMYSGICDATGSVNAAALDLRRANVDAGSYVALDYLGADTLLKDIPEFTIEFFAKFNSAEHSPWWPILSDGQYNNRWVFPDNTDCDGKRLCCYVYVATDESGNAGSVSLDTGTMSKSVCDGEWHHFALRVSTTQKFAAIDIDYGQLAHVQKSLPDATLYFQANSAKLCVGGMTASKRYCDMVLDEIRVTGRILETYEFMNTRHQTVAMSTRAWARFEDDEWQIGPEVEGLPCTTSSFTLSKGYGGTLPTLQSSAGRPYLQETSTSTNIDNLARASLVQFAEVYSEDIIRARNLRNATYEAFVKVNAITIAADSSKFTHIFYVGASSQNPDVGLRLSRYNENSYYSVIVWRKETNVRDTLGITNFADGKWHHHAITFSETTNATSGAVSTTVTYYRDYEQKATTTVDYARVMSTATEKTTIGAGDTWGSGHDYEIDEIRVSEGVLPTSSFMRRCKNGSVILFW